jgi:hypothetical protein
MWLEHARRAEKILVLYYTMQEFVLSSFYTWSTFGFVRERSMVYSGGLLEAQSKRARRNLLLFMVFAQVLTLLVDLAMVTLIYLELMYKTMLHAFCYGVKLKVEFLALNQLQNMVQGRNDIIFTGGPTAANTVRPCGAIITNVRRFGSASADSEQGEPCHGNLGTVSHNAIRKCPDLQEFKTALTCKEEKSQSINQGNQSGDSAEESISDLERQYLGRYST